VRQGSPDGCVWCWPCSIGEAVWTMPACCQEWAEEPRMTNEHADALDDAGALMRLLDRQHAGPELLFSGEKHL